MPAYHSRFKYSLLGPHITQPLVVPGLFQDGTTQPIEAGQLLELTAQTPGGLRWVPLDDDFAMQANIAIAGTSIRPGDRAGYYQLVVPRPGDVFELDLDAPAMPRLGADLFYASAESVQLQGQNPLGQVAGFDHYPNYQGHLSVDASHDSGEAIRSTPRVYLTFREAVSYWRALQAA